MKRTEDFVIRNTVEKTIRRLTCWFPKMLNGFGGKRQHLLICRLKIGKQAEGRAVHSWTGLLKRCQQAKGMMNDICAVIDATSPTTEPSMERDIEMTLKYLFVIWMTIRERTCYFSPGDAAIYWLCGGAPGDVDLFRWIELSTDSLRLVIVTCNWHGRQLSQA